ncbi:MAG TPA: exodeoxyribonuclease VII large subunit [Gemmatimonadales bacterium]|nr:exodeoxyribonuclease VII large subunit [Gemmatimonadales bacterium]
MTLTLPLDTPVPADEVWSVSQVTSAVRKLIDRGVSTVWVRGEVLQCKAWSSGHWYFTLRDDRSQFRCCMWKQNALKAGKPPADGTEVYALGTPSLWEEKGEFRFTVTTLIPTAAIGLQQQELERVKALLQKEGLFDVARKRPVPELASTIAVVTSTDGAALRDIVTVTRRRWPAARLLVVSARVQGAGSAAEIARALRIVNRLPGLDLCIVGRGGGAREDLAAFNDEQVCRALAAVSVPTISAVGHETDISLTDLVADLRAATPSAAAEAAVSDRRDVLRVVDDLASRLGTGLSMRTSLAAERLERTADRMTCAIRDMITARRAGMDRLGAELNALSPLRVLQRGYALPTGPEGSVLKRSAQFTPGLPFTLRVADGDVRARVEPES